MCTKFGVDSSSRFPFGAQTDRQTDVTKRPSHAGGYDGVGNNGSLFGLLLAHLHIVQGAD